MDPRLFLPYLVAALIVWRLYRRTRRSFGRQPVRDRYMWFRIGLLTLAAAAVGVLIARDVEVLGTLLGGIACGAALAALGIKYTRFEVTAQGRFYTPHTYIGLVVTALFVGRLLYGFLEIYNGVAPMAAAGQGLAAAYERSPFTLAAFGALVGYYVLYYLSVLQRTRPQAPLAQESAAGRAQGQ
jgi:hypothetical protein